MEKAKVIDLFAGCGGLSHGFARDGYTVTRAVEIDGEIAGTYRRNHPGVEVIVDDIRHIDQTGIFHAGDAQVIIGGPPCQGFSMAGARIRRGFIDDPRNYLFKHYLNVVRTVGPEVFVMENVKGMMTMQGGAIFREILRIFSDPELLDGRPYHLYYKLVNAAEYGVPQRRERLFIIGSRRELPDFEGLWQAAREELRRERPDWFDAVTVRDAIGNLPLPTAEGLIPAPAAETAYQRYLSGGEEEIGNHTATNHSKLAVERMSRVGGGENFTVLGEKIKSVHSGAYGRLCWDEPAQTVTTRFDTPAGGRFIHPAENRTITPREAARLQSFPDGFGFYGSRTSVCKQIGNAVPPKVSYFLARLVDKVLSLPS